jgi:DNA-binding MarR family transcriptional regulator
MPMEMDVTTLGAELDARLLALYLKVGRDTRREMSRSAASVLGTLRDMGPSRITELAAAEAVAQPSMTTLVARLERDGLVTRGTDPDDARAVRVAITAEGLERLARMRAERAALMEARLAELEPQERAAVAAALPALQKLSEGKS